MQGFGLKGLYQATYIYLALPLFIFFMGWLDYGWAALLTLLYGLAFYKAYAGIATQDYVWQLSGSVVLMLAGIAVFWCFFAGIGYFYYQSFDYHFRNAVFRDLITYDWPVMYDRADTPMVYYMAFWLFPALLAKISALTVHNAYWNFYVANIYLFIYAATGVTLIFMQLAAALKTRGWKPVLAAALMFMLFSGLDIIGILFFRVQEQPFAYHLDWWATFIQYSSFSTGMFWVFNQFIPIALLTLLIYNERRIKTFGLLVAMSLFFSPYPTAGIGILAVAYAGREFWRSAHKKKFMAEEIFSVPNLIGAFWLLPVIALYFITNSEGMGKLIYIFSYTTPKRLIIFMILEFLLYAAILAPRYCRNAFFIAAVLSLAFIPFFRIDEQNNFCMRASIPGLIILALFVFRYLFESFRDKQRYWGSAALILLLVTGAATPLTEFYRGLHYTYKEGRLGLVADRIYTLNKAFVQMPVFGWDANHQFTAKKYRTDIFWQFLAKKHAPGK